MPTPAEKSGSDRQAFLQGNSLLLQPSTNCLLDQAGAFRLQHLFQATFPLMQYMLLQAWGTDHLWTEDRQALVHSCPVCCVSDSKQQCASVSFHQSPWTPKSMLPTNLGYHLLFLGPKLFCYFQLNLLLEEILNIVTQKAERWEYQDVSNRSYTSQLNNNILQTN